MQNTYQRLPRRVVPVAAGITMITVLLMAQPGFRGTEVFPPEEFAARRTQVMSQIGDGVAIVLGATEPPGEVAFRQNNQFFHTPILTELI